MPNGTSEARERPPIVAIVGHIDHGKSTLLDYIRRTNVVEAEAGGITQHLSAYEAVHTNSTGEHRITFLDTPGHEAFRAMRTRGLEVADVAVLVVSAEDGVKPQTLEALRLIEEVQIPFIVAITKIDKPGVYIEKAKNSLLENGVFLEGMGGTVPSVGVSGKSGEGVEELLDLILLQAELEGLTSEENVPAEGVVIEGLIESKRGNSGTLIVKRGILRSGEYVVAGESFAPVRIMENFLGKPIKEARPGSPVRIVGFSSLPAVGSAWRAVENKKQAEAEALAAGQKSASERLAASAKTEARRSDAGELQADAPIEEKESLIVPLVIKTDVAGMGEAVLHELEKIPTGNRMEVRVVSQSVGNVTQDDVRLVGAGSKPGIIVGFNVKVDVQARELAERLGVKIELFNIIYKLAEWLAAELEERRPRERSEEVTGSAKLLKVFSGTKAGTVVGGRVESGTLAEKAEVRIMRQDAEIGAGTIMSLQSHKQPAKKVETGQEFGMLLKTDASVAAGDRIEAFEVIFK